MPRGMRIAGYAAVAVLLLVIGAALRPLFIDDDRPADPVLDAVEIGFVQDMTAHHQQALQMVQRLDPAVDPAVTRLAQQMADTQRLEIGTMLGWLRLSNASPLSPQPMAWMHEAGTEPDHHHAGSAPAAETTGHTMPGMATMAELDALAAARGVPRRSCSCNSCCATTRAGWRWRKPPISSSNPGRSKKPPGR